MNFWDWLLRVRVHLTERLIVRMIHHPDLLSPKELIETYQRQALQVIDTSAHRKPSRRNPDYNELSKLEREVARRGYEPYSIDEIAWCYTTKNPFPTIRRRPPGVQPRRYFP